MENKSPWVKASEMQIDRERKIYFAKVDYINIFTKEPDFIKGSGSFSSQGTFFWREPGYTPISANKYDELYLLDESLITTLQSENARLQNEVDQLKATIEGMEANYYSPDEITAIKEASYHAGKVGGYY